MAVSNVFTDLAREGVLSELLYAKNLTLMRETTDRPRSKLGK